MKVRESLTEELRRRALGEKLEAPAVPPDEAFEPVASSSSSPSPSPAPTPAPEAAPEAAAEGARPEIRQAVPQAVPQEVPMETAVRAPTPASEPRTEPAPAPRTYAPRPTTPPSEARWDRPEAAPEPARAASSPAPSPVGAPARAPEPVETEAQGPEAAYDEAEYDDEDAAAPAGRPSARAFERRRAFSLDGDPYDAGRYRIKIFDLVKEDIQGKERPVKFTVLDNAWDLMSEEQTPGEQAVYIKLYRMSYGFGNRTCVVSVLDVARKMNIARNTARTYLRGLEDKGHIRELYPEFKNRGKVYWVEFPREYLAKKAQAEGRDRAAKAFETSMAKLKEMGIL